MIKKEIDICEKLIASFCKATNKEQKEKIRNKLFFELEEQIIKWMTSIMKNKMYFTDTEMKSNCWECFTFCLNHYKPDRKIPLPNHFYAYTKFYLLSKTIKKNNENLEDYNENAYDLSIFESLDDLKMFKKFLPQEYLSIFDDALMSMSRWRKDRVRRLEETPVKYYQYCEAKKIFRIVIDFLLRR